AGNLAADVDCQNHLGMLVSHGAGDIAHRHVGVAEDDPVAHHVAHRPETRCCARRPVAAGRWSRGGAHRRARNALSSAWERRPTGRLGLPSTTTKNSTLSSTIRWTAVASGSLAETVGGASRVITSDAIPSVSPSMTARRRSSSLMLP